MRFQDKENETNLKNLTLGIQGLIIFSLIEEVIDFKATNIFKSEVSFKINLVAAVLVETFSSFNCYRKKKGPLEMLMVVIYLDNEPYGR